MHTMGVHTMDEMAVYMYTGVLQPTPAVHLSIPPLPCVLQGLYRFYCTLPFETTSETMSSHHTTTSMALNSVLFGHSQSGETHTLTW